MINLIGTYECKVDSKGRVMMPSAIKRQLGNIINQGFVLKRSVFSKCLELHPLSQWESLMSQVNQLNRFVKKPDRNESIFDIFLFLNDIISICPELIILNIPKYIK